MKPLSIEYNGPLSDLCNDNNAHPPHSLVQTALLGTQFIIRRQQEISSLKNCYICNWSKCPADDFTEHLQTIEVQFLLPSYDVRPDDFLQPSTPFMLRGDAG
ncbi:hypothetical protein HELRODRAFT_160972 [Helobdella robusta]|uniref:Uncharacterized protein n=1 Tax=Helobdella robusta TaxID=6412 RepID=T1EQY0_HELRO|nr:hypothetical protein HELRODRAFT_160972 [Helobdella robusta]ESO01805.1 hypothetical protein HELRODRAFT_160972 [Helobdella robusta]